MDKTGLFPKPSLHSGSEHPFLPHILSLVSAAGFRVLALCSAGPLKLLSDSFSVRKAQASFVSSLLTHTTPSHHTCKFYPL